MTIAIDELERLVDLLTQSFNVALAPHSEVSFIAQVVRDGETPDEAAMRLTATANGLSELAVLMDQVVMRLHRHPALSNADRPSRHMTH